MPSGVVLYKGKRGEVWRIRYVDAVGRQIQETLKGEGWTKRKAQKELEERRVRVRKENYRQPEPTGFESFARDWKDTYVESKGLKRSTREGYDAIVNSHLIPVFGSLKLEAIDVERIESYIAKRRLRGLGPRTVNRHLNVLSLILGSAVKRQLIRANPIANVDRPPEPRRRWRILSPAEVRAVEKAFDELIAEPEEAEERAWRETCRVVFLIAYGLGLRRGEILGLHWRTVRLADPDGATLRVEETLVRGRKDTPKSEAGERTIAVGSRVADELFQHRGRTHYAGEDERVFVSPHRGSPLNPKRYAETFRAALAKAEIEGYVRPFHDGRHSAITNAAAAGTSPAALMARAGHSDFKTTQAYIDLAGERFRDEAELLERRLWGDSGTKSRYNEADSSPVRTTEEAV